MKNVQKVLNTGNIKKIVCNILDYFGTLFIVSSPNKQSPGTLALIYGLQTVIFFISSPRF